MPAPITPPTPSPRRTFLLAAALVATVILAYWNTRGAPLIFDDFNAVTVNATIHQFSTALSPPADGGTTTGRPLLNLSFALNYAISGEQVWSYHALNILIHAAAALVLFGLVRRTLDFVGRGLRTPLGVGDIIGNRRGSATPPYSQNATLFAFIIALLWAVHPLQTESVACIAQRSESLSGLFYLAVLYGLARGTSSPSAGGWLNLSLFACLAGMATKEVMVTAPLLALLYDRTFLAGSFAAAWRERRGYYTALAGTWLLLAWLVFGGGGTRGQSAGFGLGITPWDYLLTQCDALLLYLKLSLWPHPLVVDYGTEVVASWREVWWQGPAVLALLAGTGWALWRRPVLGFLGAWFFLILAPSSSVLPLVSQTVAEHRMYLPLAAVIALAVGAAAARLTLRALLTAGLILALAATLATRQRNKIYLDEQALWEDVIAHRPANGRAFNNLGRYYYAHDRLEEAVHYYLESIRRTPTNPYAHHNLGLALMHLDRLAAAEAPFRESIRLQPDLLSAHLNLGIVLTKLGRAPEALPEFAAALALGFRSAEIHFQWGVALAQLGRWPEAIAHYTECLRLSPHYAEAQSNWGTALLAQKSIPEAIGHFEAALRLQPNQPEVQYNLGQADSALGRRPEAIAHFREAIRLNPAHVNAQLNLGIALAEAGELPEAIEHLAEAVRLQPASAAAHTNLGVALGLAGRPADALASYQAALGLSPGDAQANYNVGYALLEAGRPAEARPYFEAALRLRPDFPAARDMLSHLPETPAR